MKDRNTPMVVLRNLCAIKCEYAVCAHRWWRLPAGGKGNTTREAIRLSVSCGGSLSATVYFLFHPPKKHLWDVAMVPARMDTMWRFLSPDSAFASVLRTVLHSHMAAASLSFLPLSGLEMDGMAQGPLASHVFEHTPRIWTLDCDIPLRAHNVALERCLHARGQPTYVRTDPTSAGLERTPTQMGRTCVSG